MMGETVRGHMQGRWFFSLHVHYVYHHQWYALDSVYLIIQLAIKVVSTFLYLSTGQWFSLGTWVSTTHQSKKVIVMK